MGSQAQAEQRQVHGRLSGQAQQAYVSELQAASRCLKRTARSRQAVWGRRQHSNICYAQHGRLSRQTGFRATRPCAHHQMGKAGDVRGAVLIQLAQACNVKAAKLCQLGQALQAVQPVAASEAEALHRGARCKRHRLQLCAGIIMCQQGCNRQSESTFQP